MLHYLSPFLVRWWVLCLTNEIWIICHKSYIIKYLFEIMFLWCVFVASGTWVGIFGFRTPVIPLLITTFNNTHFKSPKYTSFCYFCLAHKKNNFALKFYTLIARINDYTQNYFLYFLDQVNIVLILLNKESIGVWEAKLPSGAVRPFLRKGPWY